MTNAEIREIVFDKIKECGFKPYDIQNIDGYFIFEKEKDSVTHFRIKGKGMWKHWKFGLWIDNKYMTDEELTNTNKRHEEGDYDHDPKVIQLFTQHDTWCDKFKPSRCNLLVEIDNDSLNKYLTQNTNSLYKIEDMLRMMIKHPFMCYNEYCGGFVGFTDESFFLSFLKIELRDKLETFKKRLLTFIFLPYTKLKILLAKHSKFVESIELYDFEKENVGWSTDYLYEVNIKFKSGYEYHEMNKWLNFWWHKQYYGYFNKYDKVIEVNNYIPIVGTDEYFTFE